MIALNGMAFDLSTSWQMTETVLAGIAAFGCQLINAHSHPRIAAAKAGGKQLGRKSGHSPKLDRLTPKVLALSKQDAATG